MTTTRMLGTLSLAALTLLGTLGCAGASPTQGTEAPPAEASQAPEGEATEAPPADEEPTPDLTGEWTQTNRKSEDSYQAATITADTIEVYWVTDGGDTTSLYWAGTFAPPTEAGTYSWDSENDTTKTDGAMLASGDPTKTFTYQNDVISYKVTALGTTTKVELGRE